MVNTTDTIESLIRGAMEECDTKEVQFKLRQALQLLLYLENQHDLAEDILATADLDPETQENLRELGYLE